MTLRWHPGVPVAELRSAVTERVRRDVDARALARLAPADRRIRVREQVLTILSDQGAVLPAREVTRLVSEVSDEVVGLGPIEPLLRDPEVTEVMVNGADDVYVERGGRLERVEHGLFMGEESVHHLIERVIGPLGLRVDESCPYVDARLPDGSRFHAVIPPLSLRGPVVTVRRFGAKAIGPEDLLRLGSATPHMLDHLAEAVRGRANVLISGGASSGKTTLLGALSSFIPEQERVITIEDAAELRIPLPHLVRLEARPPNVEGRGGVTVRDLVRNALRMRPDRILIGEVRGGEALDMLQAMNTGHEGSMCTAHANSPRELISRLETMALMSDVRLPVSHVRQQIATTLDLIVQTERRPDGRRLLARITAVRGMRDGDVRLEDLFRHEGRA